MMTRSASNLMWIMLLGCWESSVGIILSFLIVVSIFKFLLSTKECLWHEFPLLRSLGLSIISPKILCLRAKYEHFRIQSCLLVPRITFLLPLLLISNSWKLEVFWDLSVFEASSNLVFELSEFLFHTRVDIATVIIQNKVLSPVYGPYDQTLLI